MKHQWQLEVEEKAKKQLQKLSSQDRMRVFDSLADLLKASDPTSVCGVKKIVGTGNWRQRQGNYRIIFEIESGETLCVHIQYKGTLHVLAIEKRCEATYR